MKYLLLICGDSKAYEAMLADPERRVPLASTRGRLRAAGPRADP
ncbi:hypothetical protein [Nonomuraea sp. NPDC005650]